MGTVVLNLFTLFMLHINITEAQDISSVCPLAPPSGQTLSAPLKNRLMIWMLLVPSRSWTRVRNRKPLALRAWGVSAAAPATCSPASCTSSAKAACDAMKTTRTSWSSCRRTRPRRRKARPSSPSAVPRSGGTPQTAWPTSGVSATSDLTHNVDSVL